MAKGFGGIGHCARCGDTQGPFTLYPNIGWLCDLCADAEDRAQFEKDQKALEMGDEKWKEDGRGFNKNSSNT